MFDFEILFRLFVSMHQRQKLSKLSFLVKGWFCPSLIASHPQRTHQDQCVRRGTTMAARVLRIYGVCVAAGGEDFELLGSDDSLGLSSHCS